MMNQLAQTDITERQKAIIATLMVQPNRWHEVKNKLKPMMFAGVLNKAAAFIWEKQEERKKYDLSALKSEFGPDLIMQLVSSTTNKDMLEEHAQRVHDHYMANLHYEKTLELIASVEGGCSFSEALSAVNNEIELVRSQFSDKESREDVYREVLKEIYEAKNNEGLAGVPSGWAELDKYLGGFLPGTLYGIIARPGMGKTTTMCCMADHQERMGYKVAIFSMGDINKRKLIKKMVSVRTGIDFYKIIEGGLTDDELKQVAHAIDEFNEGNIEIFDVSDVRSKKVMDIADKIYDLQREGQTPDIVYIDYIQQLRPQNSKLESSPNAKTEEISGNIQYVCGLLNIPFVMYSQLSRAVETRGGSKRPQMSDVRNSGAIEQDCRVMLSLYRGEYYDIKEDEEGHSLIGITEIECLKNDVRDKLARIRLKWRNARLFEEGEDGFDDNAKEITPVLVTRKADVSGDEDIPF